MGEPSQRLAISPDGRQVAIQGHDADSWFISDSATWRGSFHSNLPDGWALYVPATERDRLAEEMKRVADAIEDAAGSLDWLKRRAGEDSES